MRIFIYTSISGLLLTACVTAAPPQPNLPAPPAFKGDAGWDAVKGETKLLSLTGNEDEVFMRQKVNFRRTGVLENDVTTKSIWGENVLLKAGSPMYASSYTDRSNISGGGYGIAWCSPGDVDVSGLENFLVGGRATTCLTWNRKTGNIIPASGSGADSAFYSNSMTVTAANSVTFPNIKETGQSLDSDFYFTGEISGINLDKNIRFRERFEDKSGRTTIRTTKYKLDDNGEAIVAVWGGKLAIKPTSETSFTVREITPLQDHIMSREERVEKFRELLDEAIEKRKEANEKKLTGESET
ncbi:MAG: hypothetical protein ABJ275_11125 [Maricaulaceae bacterium]